MSGPEEVERLIEIVAAGVRGKMMRPKCLARRTWKDDSDRALLRLFDEETAEMLDARRAYRRALVAFGSHDPLAIESRRAMILEVWDMAAFAAMLDDPLREPTERGTATGEDRVDGTGEPYR